MGHAPTSSTRVLRAILSGIAASGADCEAFLRELGVSLEGLGEETRIPFSVLRQAWILAPLRSGDDAFGSIWPSAFQLVPTASLTMQHEAAPRFKKR